MSLHAYMERSERQAMRAADFRRNTAFYRRSMRDHAALDHDPRNYFGCLLLAQAVRAVYATRDPEMSATRPVQS